MRFSVSIVVAVAAERRNGGARVGMCLDKIRFVAPVCRSRAVGKMG